jgi:hypothetical protein
MSFHFTDDRVIHVCECGWRGRWDEAFAHVVAERDHRIIAEQQPVKPPFIKNEARDRA